MIPETHIRYSVRGGFVYPSYLDERDYSWLASLIEVVQGYAGKSRRDLAARLLEELPVVSPPGKKKLAVFVLQRMMKDRSGACIPPKKIRGAAFAAGAKEPNRRAALGLAGGELGLTTEEVERWLFADLAMERSVNPLPEELGPERLAREVNQRLVQALLFRASEVSLELLGNSRAVVRYAKWRGLICNIEGDIGEERAQLKISGPYSLFRRTLLYGKALSELVPLLASCNDFRLTATCVLKGRETPLELQLRACDRIAWAPPLTSRFDSKVEATFAKDFGKLASAWDLIREPEPISVGSALLFPDFCLQHRRDPKQKWLLEIIGFWTPEYLTRKIEQLSRAGIANLILCVDEKLGCSEEPLLRQNPSIFYRKRIDPRLVLALVESPLPANFIEQRAPVKL